MKFSDTFSVTRSHLREFILFSVSWNKCIQFSVRKPTEIDTKMTLPSGLKFTWRRKFLPWRHRTSTKTPSCWGCVGPIDMPSTSKLFDFRNFLALNRQDLWAQNRAVFKASEKKISKKGWKFGFNTHLQVPNASSFSKCPIECFQSLNLLCP